MLGLNVFIVGMEKSGTTSLADWLVGNQIARYRVSGMKEPYAYASEHFLPPPALPGEVLLDASTGYALNPDTLRRMPEHNTKIVLCVRNYFERCFSAYIFYRTTVMRDDSSVALLNSIPDHLALSRADSSIPPAEFLFEHFLKIYKIHAPVKSTAAIRKYYELQARNILEQSFSERVHYEIGFFLSRRQLPFFSVLNSSFLTHPLKNLLAKYRAEDIHLVSINQLNCPAQRKAFVEKLVGNAPSNLSAIPSLNRTCSNAESEFEKPELAALKQYFRSDFESFTELVEQHGLSTRFANLDELRPA